MTYDHEKLSALLGDPRIAPVAADAIRGWDLSKEPFWDKTTAQIRDEHVFAGEIACGFDRLFRAADTGAWYYPLYSEKECAEDPSRRGTNVVWFPSDDPAADGRPFILLVPGGGFVNVWSLTEGWPVAAQFNRCGYHVFILTYQVGDAENLLAKDLGDMARALELIRENAECFRVDPGRYITCGFSAGGYLVCLWNTKKGYPAFGLPKPQAVFPVYPFVSPRLDVSGDQPESDTEDDLKEDLRLYGCSVWDAVKTDFEVPEHAEGFPPCALFLAAGDELVSPEHSRLLAAALDRLGVPCRLEIGPEGGHGFADGSGMCMAGWPERAVRWYESLPSPGC